MKTKYVRKPTRDDTPVVKRYCRVDTCKALLPPSRYFTCKKCQPDLPSEDPWEEHLPDMDWQDETKAVDTNGSKQCSTCRETKPKAAFSIQRQRYGCNLRPRCKACDNAIRSVRDKAKRLEAAKLEESA